MMCQKVEFMSRKKCKKLSKNRVTVRHGLVPPGFNELSANPLYHDGDSKPLLYTQSIDGLRDSSGRTDAL